jgi:hypothetical protein
MPVEGRGLSSRRTQYVVKDLGDWASYKLRKGFRNCRWRCTRKQRREVLSESRMPEIGTSDSTTLTVAGTLPGWKLSGVKPP